MKLERIIAREFMGMSFDERLTAANVFIATNWAGKTARANAITVLLLGYLPKLGKRNQDTARLMSAREMHVEGHFTGGIVMSRTFRMSGASVKCDAKIPPELAGEGTLAIMLNANEYFAQTDQQRRDYVFGLLDLSALTQFSEDSMIGELREAVKAASGDDEATRKAVGALVARIQRAANEAERDIPRDASCAPGEDPTLTPQQWLSTALEAAADFTKTAKEYAARMEKTVQGITTLKLQDTAPAVSLTAVEAQRERVTRERDNIVQRREELLAQKKQIDAARLNRGRLTEMLRELQPRIEALATLKQRLAANTAGTPEAQSAREEIVRERTKLDTRQHEIDSAAVRRREINAQLPSLRRARDKATACRDHLAELEKTFEAIATGSGDANTPASFLDLGTDVLPPLPLHGGDRNRTSPFAFTGNKFEFRALGSSMSLAFPNTVLNTIAAEAIDELADKLQAKLDSGTPMPEAVMEIVKESYSANKVVCFGGDNYSEEWHAEAEERGLKNLRTTPDDTMLKQIYVQKTWEMALLVQRARGIV